MGLEFEGREHSGIADARNTARLVHCMHRAGCGLAITATRAEDSAARANTAHRSHIHTTSRTLCYMLYLQELLSEQR